MSLKSGNLFFAGLFSISATYGQNAINPKVAEALSGESSFSGQVYSYNPFGAQAIFWPDDLKHPVNNADRPDHFIKCGKDFYILPDGTNRVYRINGDSSKKMVSRLDRSPFAGHNFSAFKFCFNDSLYALGGFGFGHYNGLLLKFEPRISDWSLQNINKEIVLESGLVPGIWLNSDAGKIFRIGNNSTAQAGRDEVTGSGRSVFVLDMKKRRWLSAGFPTPECIAITERSVRIAGHPSGELVLKNDAAGQTLYLLDYITNSIRPAKTGVSETFTSIFTDTAGYRGRYLIWHSRDTLNILSADGSLRKQRLSSDDFTGMYTSIWTDSEAGSISGWNIFMAGLFLFGSGMLVAVIWFFRRKKSPETPEKMLQAESIFTRPELEILRALQISERKELLPDDVNELLGTSKKTIEVQKKQRSDSIKGINEKYRRLSQAEENIILQERLEDDRRQVRYLLNRPAIEKLKRMVSGI